MLTWWPFKDLFLDPRASEHYRSKSYRKQYSRLNAVDRVVFESGNGIQNQESDLPYTGYPGSRIVGAEREVFK